MWTIFRAEVAHFKTQHVAYRKTGLEWEILGDLGVRLHHKEEAKEAYQRCLDTPRYSYKPWSKILDMYAEEGDIQRSLQAAVRVAAYQWGEYAEMTVCLVSILRRMSFIKSSDSILLRSPVVSSSLARSTATRRSSTPC